MRTFHQYLNESINKEYFQMGKFSDDIKKLPPVSFEQEHILEKQLVKTSDYFGTIDRNSRLINIVPVIDDTKKLSYLINLLKVDYPGYKTNVIKNNLGINFNRTF